MPDNHQKPGLTRGKKATIVVLIILVIIILLLLFLGTRNASAEADSRSFLGRTIAQIGSTITLVGDYARSAFTGEPFEQRESPLVGTGEDGEAGALQEGGLAPLSPPTVGGSTTILESIIPGLSANRGTFIINTNLRVTNGVDISGEATLDNASVSGNLTADSITTGQLTVLETMEALGLISATGGITTGGANIDLGGGQILGLEYVQAIEAGENVVITNDGGTLVISVPNIGRSGGGGSSAPAGVASLNGLTGALTLLAGTDIAINGLEISNTSTLESVRLRGGCVGCLTDNDVADNLTISGGLIDNTPIGSFIPAPGFFTEIAIGEAGSAGTLTVDGSGSFTGTVSGADAVDLDDFVTLSQLNGAIFGGGGGVLSLNGLVGALTVVGTAGQINVTPSGSTITLALPQGIGMTDSPTFSGLTLNGLLNVIGDIDVTGVVTAGTFVSDAADATIRKSGEEIFRLSASIFPYALPAETGSASFTRVSKEFTSAFDNPLDNAPDPIPGTTRIYKFVIKYADSVPTASDSSWRVYKPSTSTVVDSFTFDGLNLASLEEPEVLVTDPVAVPSGDWRLEVSVPSGRIRVMDIHIAAFDVVN